MVGGEPGRLVGSVYRHSPDRTQLNSCRLSVRCSARAAIFVDQYDTAAVSVTLALVLSYALCRHRPGGSPWWRRNAAAKA
jgi:hypothetical protein